MKARLLLLTAICTAFLGNTALACGDSLYRVGKGTPYRTYTTPLPGNLLVMADSQAGMALAQMLADSGHEVEIVADPDDLTEALQQGGHDVVIAPFKDRGAVAAAGESGTVYFPVVMDKAEKKLAQKEFSTVLASTDDIKRYLKKVHKTLKTRA